MCYSCGSTNQLRSACPEHTQKAGSSCAMGRQQKEGKGESSKEVMLLEPAYHVNLSIQFSNKIISVNAVIDSGSPISSIKCYMVKFLISTIIGSVLNIQSVARVRVFMADCNINKQHLFYIVDHATMSVGCLLGRDFIKGLDISFGKAGVVALK